MNTPLKYQKTLFRGKSKWKNKLINKIFYLNINMFMDNIKVRIKIHEMEKRKIYYKIQFLDPKPSYWNISKNNHNHFNERDFINNEVKEKIRIYFGKYIDAYEFEMK